MKIELPQEGIDLIQTLESVEQQLIAQALERCEGNRTHAAELLSINRTTLVEKIRRLGMPLGKAPKRKTA